MFLEAFIAALAIALISIVGVFFLGKSGHITGTHRFIIPAAIGVFLGVIFFELIPETLEEGGVYGSAAIAAGFMLFYLLSNYLRTYHDHHTARDEKNTFRGAAQMLLIGDTVHNIADGVTIASAFLINPAIGIAVTIGIALHELPQEITEFAVLIKAGYSRKRALIYNFLSASSILLGVILASIFFASGNYIWILTGIAAGNLLYIAAADMIPELNDSEHRGHFLPTFLSTLIGLIAIAALLLFIHETFEPQHEENEVEELHESIA